MSDPISQPRELDAHLDAHRREPRANSNQLRHAPQMRETCLGTEQLDTRASSDRYTGRPEVSAGITTSSPYVVGGVAAVADVGGVGGGSRRLREREREGEGERGAGGGGRGRFLARAVARLLLCKETGETVLFVDKAYDEAGGAAHTGAPHADVC